jgi:hypothetical protein
MFLMNRNLTETNEVIKEKEQNEKIGKSLDILIEQSKWNNPKVANKEKVQNDKITKNLNFLIELQKKNNRKSVL